MNTCEMRFWGFIASLRGVAYVLNTTGHTADHKLGRMILPQREEGRHGAEAALNPTE